MVGIGATVGKVGYSPSVCYSNQQINAIVFDKKKVIPKFGAYYLLNRSDEINKKTPVVTLQIFNQSKVKQIEIEYPSLYEQQRIVSYLDAKTAEIDRKISLLEKKRDAYMRLKTATINHAVTRGLNPDAKLKDSGVEWIGLVPEHWEVKRLKEEVSCIQSGKRPIDDNEDVLSIGGEHIQNGMFYLENKKHVSLDTYRYSQGKIEIGDTLIVKDGATIGKCMFVDEKPEERMLVNEHVYRIKCSKYIFYFLSSPFSQYWFRSRNMSSAQESINRTTIDNLPTLIPSLSEQIEISDFLNSECVRISAMIKIVDNQIDAYKRLKRSLINEVVTGQRNV